MSRATVSWFERPINLGIIGLAMMLVGYKASSHETFGSRAASQVDQMGELQNKSEDSELNKRIQDISEQIARKKPFRIPGQLAFMAGLILFAAAGARMWQMRSNEEEAGADDMPGEEKENPDQARIG